LNGPKDRSAIALSQVGTVCMPMELHIRGGLSLLEKVPSPGDASIGLSTDSQREITSGCGFQLRDFFGDGRHLREIGREVSRSGIVFFSRSMK